jgi:hypothetical protein
MVRAGQRYILSPSKKGGDGCLKRPPIWMMCQSKRAIATMQ